MSGHIGIQRLRHYDKRALRGGRIGGARKLIAERRAHAKGFTSNDPQAIDGDETEVALLAAQGRFAEAKSASESVVKLRRRGPANEQLLLCWALLQHAIVLDGAGDTAVADKALVESIGAARQAFPAGDVRRAQMLEAFADLLARGYSRPLAGISLYKAAIEMRGTMPGGSKAELAEAFRS